MKHPSLTAYRVFFFLIASVIAWSCKTDDARTGADILTDDDHVIVRADTFPLTSTLVEAEPLAATPDSFLLGEMDNKYGHLHADFMTQLACPIGFVYPENAVLDSVCLYIYYQQAFGDGDVPLAINIYQMDKATFNYNEPLFTNLPVDQYCSLHDSTRITEYPYVVTANKYTDSTYASALNKYIPTIAVRMPDNIAERIFAIRDFSSQEAFNALFKGVYLTTSFGGSTLLNIIDVNMGIYYHFTYVRAGQDTVVEKDMKGFYANHEVRQLNRYEWQASDFTPLEQNTDTTYIVSPVHLYTRLTFPLHAMQDSIFNHMGGKRPYVNRAQLVLPVLNYYTGTNTDKQPADWAQPAQTMLLIREADFKQIVNNEDIVLSDSIAMYATLQYTTDSLDQKSYSYTFDLSTILTRQLRSSQFETLDMLLMPITIATTTSSSGTTSITDIQYNQSLTATEIYSGQNTDHGIKLEVVYSGF